MLLHRPTRRGSIVVPSGHASATRHYRWVTLCAIVLLCIQPIPTYSQPIDQCDDSSKARLDEAIRAHNDDGYRVERKFTDIYYYKGSLPKRISERISLEKITSHLDRLGDRRSAVLFHWIDHELPGINQLWTWLITSNGQMVCANPRTLTPEDWNTLDSNNWSVLGARGARQARARAVFEDSSGQEEVQRAHWGALLGRLSEILLPMEVAAELRLSDSDTLVIVPITVIRGYVNEKERMTYSLSAVPFAALPLDAVTLIDKFSIVISPGFLSFGKAPKEVTRRFRDPIVLGNPVRAAYPNLPGAEDESLHVAERLGTKAYVRKAATKRLLDGFLKQHAKSVDFIHLATHGIADAKNPLDGSFLVFSDILWTARQIGTLQLRGAPLVVMSACQTALGKDFPSGTIGLARAWQRAGASNVVMSLWSVDDLATKELMNKFVDLVASGQAVDKALQTAMMSLRDKYPNPAHWASFSIYGDPERIEETASP